MHPHVALSSEAGVADVALEGAELQVAQLAMSLEVALPLEGICTHVTKEALLRLGLGHAATRTSVGLAPILRRARHAVHGLLMNPQRSATRERRRAHVAPILLTPAMAHRNVATQVLLVLQRCAALAAVDRPFAGGRAMCTCSMAFERASVTE